MRLVWLLFAVLLVLGCGGGSGTTVLVSPYAGTWNGVWTNQNDSLDTGTSLWVIRADGTVDGQDFDPGRSTTFHVVGAIDAAGNLTSMSTPTGGSSASLNGPFDITDRNHFNGTLIWGVVPSLPYTYTFARH